MKIKILMPPLLIVATIIMLIWFIYPAYTNGTDGLKEERAKLADGQSKLDAIKTKASNIDLLYSQLQTDKDNHDVILSYIPEEAKEEDIINSLSSVAGSAGVAPTIISVSKSTVIVDPSLLAPATASDVAENPASSADSSAATMEAKVNCSVMGSYDQIKSFLDEAYHLERFNKVVSLDIKKAVDASGKNTGALEADVVLAFDFIGKSSSVANVDDPVFSNNSFSMKIAQDIKNRNNVEIPILNIDQSGRSNPFSL